MKKREGLESIKVIAPPVHMSQMELLDWYAGMALMNCDFQIHTTAAEWALDRAEAIMAERNNRGI